MLKEIVVEVERTQVVEIEQKGYSGYSGGSGYSGASGYSGYSGLDGQYAGSGYSGYSGRSGFSGIGGVAGSGEAPQIAFWQDVNTLTGDDELTWDRTTKHINIEGVVRQKAVPVPGLPGVDEIKYFVTANGVSPNRVVLWKGLLQDGTELIVASIIT